jgi:hypothetical protein
MKHFEYFQNYFEIFLLSNLASLMLFNADDSKQEVINHHKPRKNYKEAVELRMNNVASLRLYP